MYMVKKEKGKGKQRLTGPEPATSRSIADPLAAESWSLPATINPFPPLVLSRASFETPPDDKHQISIIYCYWRWFTYHGDTNERQGSELHMVKKEVNGSWQRPRLSCQRLGYKSGGHWLWSG